MLRIAIHGNKEISWPPLIFQWSCKFYFFIFRDIYIYRWKIKIYVKIKKFKSRLNKYLTRLLSAFNEILSKDWVIGPLCFHGFKFQDVWEVGIYW